MSTKYVAAVVLVCNDEYWLPWALEASRGFFDRYVIYDIGSKDKTKEIITAFKDSNPDASYYIRFFDQVLAPSIQGIFRNSMIAEAMTETYFILDGDEIYSPKSYDNILKASSDLAESDKIYGIIPRIEVDGDCKSAYGVGAKTPHHRLYCRQAIWTGNHPGEVPYIPQKKQNEMWIEGTCYHFHNCERSSFDQEVPKRIERRARATYRPGQKQPIDILKELPILRKDICNFKRSPALQNLIDGK